jgi:RNA polymerase sigma-70 factor (ECF subfamily)
MGDDRLARFYRDEFGRVLATVLRLVGDFHVAEEAVQEAFTTALERWERDGWPRNPRSGSVRSASSSNARA